MSLHTRRDALAGVAAGITALAGCTQGRIGSGATGYDITTPSSEDCGELSVPEPTATDSGLEPKPYPSIPSQLSPPSVDAFVTEFERAYRHNEFLPQADRSGYDTVLTEGGVPDWAVFEDGTGYAVGVNVTLKYGDNETTPPATQAPFGTAPKRAWYYVTPRFAVRDEAGDGDLSTGDEPRFDDPVLVACSD
ncbi:hypothetical protein [Natronomonas sp. EA1]|uniref:hypothetical protein n=1 Tax=Natronomonas sp. EA1 TaxID=3421655 RepID=UPI003EB95E5F